MPAKGTTHERCSLPEGSIVDVEVEIVGYFAPGDAELSYALRVKSDSPRSTCIGLVEMAKADLLAERAKN